MARKHRWLQLTKLEAARRQVEQALDLFFSDGDPVAIHTLLFASVEILDGLYKRRTKKRLFFNEAMIEAGVLQIAKGWGTFLKHGREWELDKTLAFNAGANDILFSACITGLDEMGVPRSELAKALAFWFNVHEPAFVTPRVAFTADERRRLRRLSNKSFLKHFREAGRRVRARRRRATKAR